MTEVAPGIHWLKMPITMPESTLEHVNAYLIHGDNGYLLVDAGWNTDEAFAYLQKQLAEIRAGIKDISQIVVTHVHPDHYGMAGRIKRLSGATMAMHEIEKGFIEPRYVRMDKLLKVMDHWLIANGAPRGEMESLRDATVGLERYIVPEYPDTLLHGGETITTGTFTFHVLWTPGHSSGHVCLYEPEKKILIAGDHVLPTITPNVGRHPQSLENPLGRYLDSLNTVKQLDVGLVLPGHEKPFTQLRPRIDEIIHHHEARAREILAAVKGEPKTAYRIAQGVGWGLMASWQTLPSFHKRMAIFEALAHLEALKIDGKIGKASRDGMIYYRQN